MRDLINLKLQTRAELLKQANIDKVVHADSEVLYKLSSIVLTDTITTGTASKSTIEESYESLLIRQAELRELKKLSENDEQSQQSELNSEEQQIINTQRRKNDNNDDRDEFVQHNSQLEQRNDETHCSEGINIQTNDSNVGVDIQQTLIADNLPQREENMPKDEKRNFVVSTYFPYVEINNGAGLSNNVVPLLNSVQSVGHIDLPILQVATAESSNQYNPFNFISIQSEENKGVRRGDISGLSSSSVRGLSDGFYTPSIISGLIDVEDSESVEQSPISTESFEVIQSSENIFVSEKASTSSKILPEISKDVSLVANNNSPAKNNVINSGLIQNDIVKEENDFSSESTSVVANNNLNIVNNPIINNKVRAESVAEQHIAETEAEKAVISETQKVVQATYTSLNVVEESATIRGFAFEGRVSSPISPVATSRFNLSSGISTETNSGKGGRDNNKRK